MDTTNAELTVGSLTYSWLVESITVWVWVYGKLANSIVFNGLKPKDVLNFKANVYM